MNGMRIGDKRRKVTINIDQSGIFSTWNSFYLSIVKQRRLYQGKGKVLDHWRLTAGRSQSMPSRIPLSTGLR